MKYEWVIRVAKKDAGIRQREAVQYEWVHEAMGDRGSGSRALTMGHLHLRFPEMIDQSKPMVLSTSHTAIPRRTRVKAAAISEEQKIERTRVSERNKLGANRATDSGQKRSLEDSSSLSWRRSWTMWREGNGWVGL
jgi:hypothetical protein